MGRKLVTSYAALGVGLAIVLTVGLAAISSVMEQPLDQFAASQRESEKMAPIAPALEAPAKPSEGEMPTMMTPAPMEKEEAPPAAKMAVAKQEVTVDINAGSATAGCEVDNKCWEPSTIIVPVGTTVVWTNKDAAGHTVTSGNPGDADAGSLFDSAKDSSDFLIKPGATWEHIFHKAGEFPYFCQVHPWMVGKVIVGEAMALPTQALPPPEMLNTFQLAVLDQIAAGQPVGSSEFTEQFLGERPAYEEMSSPPATALKPIPEPPALAPGERESYSIATEMPASPFAGLLVILPYLLAAAVGSVVFVVTRKRV